MLKGNNMTLECCATGNPLPNLEMKKDVDGKVSDIETTSISSDDKKTKTITYKHSNISYPVEGTYYCIVSNTADKIPKETEKKKIVIDGKCDVAIETKESTDTKLQLTCRSYGHNCNSKLSPFLFDQIKTFLVTWDFKEPNQNASKIDIGPQSTIPQSNGLKAEKTIEFHSPTQTQVSKM